VSRGITATINAVTDTFYAGFIPNDIRKNAQLVNTSQRPAYLLPMIQEWLNIILGFVVMMMAVVLVTLSIQLQSKAAFAGASLYSLISLGENLGGIVVFWTRLETCLGAIARLKTFNDTVKPEDRDEEDIIPAESWPQNGVVELRGVSAAYDSEEKSGGSLQLALRDIRLSISAGEKVAICGRTGSGKSSLIALLLKLLDPLSSTTENVTIDGTPLHRINRSALRQRIIAVPQEAVFLPDGTDFQTNLDPLGISTPEECEAVLAAVGLSKFVAERGGLSAGMSATTLSAGQRQLMSVGRALLRRRIQSRHNGPEKNGGILLLDEVSSSVDLDTERVMQDIIKTEFEDYTVIAVSHRLHMIMGFDRVVVMDTGKIVEVGNPIVLAVQAVSRFGDLVRAGKEK
jgi:ABC-type multidrug transport system fused ATPase/permease subunit